MIQRLIFVLMGLVTASSAFGVVGDSVSRISVKVLPVPSFGYSPETEYYVGAVALFTIDIYNDTVTRVSNAKVELNYTWRKQLVMEASWNYFFKHEQWYTQGVLHYSKFPDLYYGIGAHTPDKGKLNYQSNRVLVDITALKNTGQLFLGPRVRYSRFSGITYDSVDNHYPELLDGQFLGIGVSLLSDKRDNLLNTSRGYYISVSPLFHTDHNGSSYVKVFTDMRSYWQTSSPLLTVAGRFYNEFTFGEPPFFDMAQIGGDRLVRGYYQGRFRDRCLSSIQGEARLRVYRRWGLALFGGITSIYPNLSKIDIPNTKPNYGGGIRFNIDRKENINLRIDYARGTGRQDGFYIAFGESF